MKKENVVSIEDRIPKLKQHRKKKANRRLFFLLTLFLILILSVVYFQSPLSHVKKVEVTGNELIPDEKVLAAGGISTGTSVWGVNKNSVAAKLKKLPGVKKAEVRLTFPNTYVISIQEHDKKAYLSRDSRYYVILENGKILDKGTDAMPVDAPLLRGFKEDKVLERMMKELGKLPSEIQQMISEINLTPKDTDQYHVTLYMNDGFEVSATIRTFSEKMIHYPSIASQLDPSRKGVIDLEVGSFFKAYETEDEGTDEEGQNQE